MQLLAGCRKESFNSARRYQSISSDAGDGWQLDIEQGGDSHASMRSSLHRQRPRRRASFSRRTGSSLANWHRLNMPAVPSFASAIGAIKSANCLLGFGFVVPLVERRRILAASFATEKFPHRAPSEQIVVRVFIGGALQPQLVDLPDADLGSLAHQELGSLLKVSGGAALDDVAKWPKSMHSTWWGIWRE